MYKSSDGTAVIGGMLQILCATRGSHELVKVAVDATYEGTPQAILEALKNLKVQISRIDVSNRTRSKILRSFRTKGEFL